MNSRSKLILILIVLSFFLGILPCYAGWEPWDKTETNAKKQGGFVTSVPKIAALSAIKFYQNFISPLLRKNKCNFTPSCSRYGYQAVEKYGALKGGVMAFERLSRCHPWSWNEKYDEVRQKHLYDPPKNNYW